MNLPGNEETKPPTGNYGCCKITAAIPGTLYDSWFGDREWKDDTQLILVNPLDKRTLNAANKYIDSRMKEQEKEKEQIYSKD
jgi:hypothetical protein